MIARARERHRSHSSTWSFPGVQARPRAARADLRAGQPAHAARQRAVPVPFYESQADVDLRLLVLTLGASAGFRSDFRSLEFAAGRVARSRTTAASARSTGARLTASWGFGELRATVSLPINDYVLFNAHQHVCATRAGPTATFDWRNGIVHDGTAVPVRHHAVLQAPRLRRHRPMMQILNFELGDKRFTQINYGCLRRDAPRLHARATTSSSSSCCFIPARRFGGYDNESQLRNAPVLLADHVHDRLPDDPAGVAAGDEPGLAVRRVPGSTCAGLMRRLVLSRIAAGSTCDTYVLIDV